jgi:hypothetical protein
MLQVISPLIVKHSLVLPAGFGERCFAGVHYHFVDGAVCNTLQACQSLTMFAVYQS